jgi:hypothetical protein
MSRREVLTCDRCGKEDVPGTQAVHLQTAWVGDPAGGPGLPSGKDCDLCPACLRAAFIVVFGEIDMLKRLDLVTKILSGRATGVR